jgi:hypothetical protein
MKMSIEERVKILERKISALEGNNLIKEDLENPYSVESEKEYVKDNG